LLAFLKVGNPFLWVYFYCFNLQLLTPSKKEMMANKITIPYFLILLLFLLLASACNLTKIIKRFTENNIEPRSAWKANEPRQYKTNIPVKITVHHEGTKLTINDDAAKKINAIQRWGMGKEKNWTDIPYHFLIAPNGKVYEGRSVFTVGETSTEYNPTGHLLICCLGNLDEDKVPAAQLKALIQTINFVANKYNISLDSLATHKDFSSQTTCPGKYLSSYFTSGYIKNTLRKMK
jgi:hypothetical protein